MALIFANFSGRPADMRLAVTEGTKDVANNRTLVYWSVYYGKTAESSAFNHEPANWQVNIGGNPGNGNFTYDLRGMGVGTDRLIHSGNLWINHATDGTASIYIGVAGQDPSGYLGEAFNSDTIALVPIARASVMTWAPTVIVPGSATTIYTNRALAGFTHTITYEFGSETGTVATGVGASYVWTPPLSMLNAIPSLVSATGSFTITTYNGASLVGSTSRVFTLNAPASAVPSFSTVDNSEAVAGVAANIGAYVQGISKLNLAITGAAGYYGSTIASYKIEVGGQTINAASGVTPASISSSGTVPITATITDTRGRTATRTVNVTVLAYAPPAINEVTVTRALSSGVPNDDGTYLRVSIDASVQSLIVGTQRNEIKYRVYSRPRGGSSWTLKNSTSPGGIAFNGIRTVGTYGVEDSHDVLVEVLDDFATSAAQLTIATATIFQHWDGKLGVGIGKYRQNGMLDVAGEIYQQGAKVEPAGNVTMTARATAPAGWLICDGASVTKTAYPDLFAAIGYTYGGSANNFNIPNVKGRVPVGRNTAETEFEVLGEIGGAKTHTLTEAQMPKHNHGTKISNSALYGSVAGSATYGVDNGAGSRTTDAGSGAAHNNLQPYIVLNYIIKT